jgi:lysophospholipase L1-like esterase
LRSPQHLLPQFQNYAVEGFHASEKGYRKQAEGLAKFITEQDAE